MATASIPVTTISIEEYLRTSYRPDCDFIDGVIEERNLGEYDHSNMQASLTAWFYSRGIGWNIRVLPEQRTRVSKSRVRVPDVCLVPRDTPPEQVRVTPPILAIEILSPEDRIPRIVTRLDDFLDMGVAHLWVIDPVKRLAYTYTRGDLRLVDGPLLMITNSPIYIDLPELFASLD